MTGNQSLLVRIATSGYRWLDAFGINPKRTYLGLRGMPAFIRDAYTYRREKAVPGFRFARGTSAPCLADRFLAGGTARGAYFHQDLWAARHIYQAAPRRHIDVGSRVDGFVAHVATFRPIEVLDIRPLTAIDRNIVFRQMDVMGPLAEDDRSCCDSLSCLHALEHFGLGRYGDPVRADGFLQGWNNLHQLLEPSGMLYFSVPIGPPRIEFNAHRVFSITQIAQLIAERFSIVDFCYVDDKGDLHSGRSMDEPSAERNFDCNLGCALLALRKK
jgi:hypothetical protein